MKEKVFAEIGFGNESFLSTEIEKGKKEKRINKFIKPGKVREIYLRIWIFKFVLIFSTLEGFKLKKKLKNKFKFLIGIGGTK
jgi:hypothetical protein